MLNSCWCRTIGMMQSSGGRNVLYLIWQSGYPWHALARPLKKVAKRASSLPLIQVEFLRKTSLH